MRRITTGCGLDTTSMSGGHADGKKKIPGQAGRGFPLQNSEGSYTLVDQGIGEDPADLPEFGLAGTG